MSQISILVIDDNIDDINLISDILHGINSDIHISYCTNGEDGILELSKNKYDLLILDINMPIKDGIEILSDIRDNDINIPVVIHTTSSEQDHINSAYMHSSTNYVTKSYDNTHKMGEYWLSAVNFPQGGKNEYSSS